MASRRFLFDDPDRFITGTVGEPGQRAFYLQASQAGSTVSVAIEKAQVAALAQRLGEVLTAAADAGLLELPEAEIDTRPLAQPFVEAFQVGVLAIGLDPDSTRVTIEARPLPEEPDTEQGNDVVPILDVEKSDLLRVEMSPAQARAFAEQAATIVSAGRPACPFCGQPLEPSGHFCPRTNGRLN